MKSQPEWGKFLASDSPTILHSVATSPVPLGTPSVVIQSNLLNQKMLPSVEESTIPAPGWWKGDIPSRLLQDLQDNSLWDRTRNLSGLRKQLTMLLDKNSAQTYLKSRFLTLNVMINTKHSICFSENLVVSPCIYLYKQLCDSRTFDPTAKIASWFSHIWLKSPVLLHPFIAVWMFHVSPTWISLKEDFPWHFATWGFFSGSRKRHDVKNPIRIDVSM